MNFEKTLKNVDEIINKLSGGDVALDEAIELYNAGAKDLAECKKKLAQAEKSVMKVVSSEEL